jgi:hypothetical protein
MSWFDNPSVIPDIWYSGQAFFVYCGLFVLSLFLDSRHFG